MAAVRARDSGNKTAASAHGMGSGGLAVDAMTIGCLGVERYERFFVLCHFRTPWDLTKNERRKLSYSGTALEMANRCVFGTKFQKIVQW